jgi:hypothetical protein
VTPFIARKEMSAAIPAFEGLTLAKLGDGGIPLGTTAFL